MYFPSCPITCWLLQFLEEAKVAKARQMEQETLQFNQAVSCLLGSQTSLTRREVSQHMKTIIVGLGKVKASMQRDLQLAERCHQLNMELQHAQVQCRQLFAAQAVLTLITILQCH